MRAHFAAQFATDAVLFFLFAKGYGWHTFPYAVAFSALHILIVITAAGYALEYILAYGWYLRLMVLAESIMIPLSLGLAVAATVSRFPYWTVISLVEAVGLGTLAVATLTVAALGRAFAVPLTLGVFWLVYAAWEFLLTLQLPCHRETLIKLDEWLPAAFVVVMFGLIGIISRHESSTVRRAPA